MDKYLIVIDMQNDFVNGSLGSAEAKAIVPKVVEKVRAFNGTVIFTKDTHNSNYLNTQEGKNLPVEHCVENTEGWEIINELKEVQVEKDAMVYCKETFGCTSLAKELQKISEETGIEEIQLIGVCTDICVVSNALILKAYMPEVKITVDSKCCAGVTPKKHEAALETMRSCQINII